MPYYHVVGDYVLPYFSASMFFSLKRPPDKRRTEAHPARERP
jgi:hypothetical protein